MEDFKLNVENRIPPSRGRALLSEPFLDDNYFSRSVVLLCEHNQDGSFGFVLNNYMDISIQDILPDFPDIETRISIGGPVKTGNLYYIHTHPEVQGCQEVVDGVYIGGDFDTMKQLLAAGMIKAHEIRFFVGYSGWESGQLDEELNRHSWLVSAISGKDMMNTQRNDLWARMMKKQGGRYKAMSHFPTDPSLN
jgi:putative transcriptional regulator